MSDTPRRADKPGKPYRRPKKDRVRMLAFEALLAVGIIYAALSLLLASSLFGLLLGIAVIAVCSPIFWLLVRVMARLQVPPQ